MEVFAAQNKQLIEEFTTLNKQLQRSEDSSREQEKKLLQYAGDNSALDVLGIEQLEVLEKQLKQVLTKIEQKKVGYKCHSVLCCALCNVWYATTGSVDPQPGGVAEGAAAVCGVPGEGEVRRAAAVSTHVFVCDLCNARLAGPMSALQRDHRAQDLSVCITVGIASTTTCPICIFFYSTSATFFIIYLLKITCIYCIINLCRNTVTRIEESK